MRSLLVLVALISINHSARSAPQFSQSFSSSSVLKPNGEVSSSSIYIDSQGNQIVNGNKKPTSSGGAPQELFNFLLPPLGVPYEPVGPQTPPPVFKPVPYGQRTTTKATTTQRTTSQPKLTTKATTTQRTTVKPKTTTKKSAVTPKATVKPVPIIKSTLKPKPIVNRPRTQANVSNVSGAYVADSSGIYKAEWNRLGQYKADNRGKYDPALYGSGKYRRN